ncbi:MAG: 4-(cytidine 5'-diphospho)-2-C-methyl-D-erythritol kinase [Armatimonadota bacterium]|nr:4-(cytidine 5'-diphospho)-2-C-methyl-D-erythritol kinase [bacterium]
MNRIEIASYAKVNLTLEISEKRPDGFHEIDSVVQTIDITDDLIMEKVEPGVIRVGSDTLGVPEGRGNIVYRACEAFFARAGLRGGVECFLRKRIPMQAGLGGGSGNAAAAVAGLNVMYECGLSAGEIADIVAEVGSDSPLFVYGGTVRMRGRGELIEPLPDAPQMHMVVVKPDAGVSTAWAYGEFDRLSVHERKRAGEDAQRSILAGDRGGLISSLYNDFDPIVCAAVPDVERAKRLLMRSGAEWAMLSGSGSAVFGIFETCERASGAAIDLCGEFSQVFLTQTVGRDKSALMK